MADIFAADGSTFALYHCRESAGGSFIDAVGGYDLAVTGTVGSRAPGFLAQPYMRHLTGATTGVGSRVSDVNIRTAFRGDFTVEFVFDGAGRMSTGVVFCVRDTSAGTPVQALCEIFVPAGGAPFRFGYVNSSGSYVYYDGPTPTATGGAHYYAVKSYVVSGSRYVTWYLDGSPTGTSGALTDVGADANYTSTYMTLCARWSGASVVEGLAGTLSALRISSTARSDTEILDQQTSILELRTLADLSPQASPVSKTWYSSVDYPITSASIDNASVARRVASAAWLLKAWLKGEITGPTVGWTGARPESSKWLHVASCDGVSVSTVTDLWGPTFNTSKLVQGSSFSWIVLKSPAGFEGGPLYLLLSPNVISTWYMTAQWSTDPYTTIGTTTAYPTFANARNAARDDGAHPALFDVSLDYSTQTYYQHFTVDASGHWFLTANRLGYNSGPDLLSCVAQVDPALVVGGDFPFYIQSFNANGYAGNRDMHAWTQNGLDRIWIQASPVGYQSGNQDPVAVMNGVLPPDSRVQLLPTYMGVETARGTGGFPTVSSLQGVIKGRLVDWWTGTLQRQRRVILNAAGQPVLWGYGDNATYFNGSGYTTASYWLPFTAVPAHLEATVTGIPSRNVSVLSAPTLQLASLQNFQAQGHIVDASTFALYRMDEPQGTGPLYDSSGNARTLTAWNSDNYRAPRGIVAGGGIANFTQWDSVNNSNLGWGASYNVAWRNFFQGSYTVEFWYDPLTYTAANGRNFLGFSSAGGEPRSIDNYVLCNIKGGSNGSFGINYTLPSTSTWSPDFVSGANFLLPGPQHLALRLTRLTSTTCTIDLFRNGAKVTSFVGVESPSTSASAATSCVFRFIGFAGNGYAGPLGIYDDLRLSSIARTDAEIYESYRRGAVGIFGVTDVTPNTGELAGGTPFVIRGSGFTTGATVTFGGVAATGLVVTNGDSIAGVTPAGAAGAVDVVVTDTLTQTLTAAYTYANAAPPPIDPMTLSALSPVVSTVLAYNDAVSFDLESPAERTPQVSVKYDLSGVPQEDIVHDGVSFCWPYNLYSTRVVSGGGWTYSVRHNTGWPSAPTLSVKSNDPDTEPV